MKMASFSPLDGIKQWMAWHFQQTDLDKKPARIIATPPKRLEQSEVQIEHGW